MLSGDDMICYLLFPDVSFRCVDKWRKQDHAGVQTVLRYGHKEFSGFLNYYPDLSVLFLLFVLVGFVFETDWWKRHMIVGLNQSL